MSGATQKSVERGWLDVEELRLIADLRVMHSKVDELHSIVKALMQRSDIAEVVMYADAGALSDDINQVDEIYMWFLRLKESSYRIG